VELRHLRALVVLAEELSFTRAARRLGIAQPALSAQISRLERRLGSKLVERSTRSVELTSAGHELLALARRALAEADPNPGGRPATGSGGDGGDTPGLARGEPGGPLGEPADQPAAPRTRRPGVRGAPPDQLNRGSSG
jgi:hypothetical protein